MATKKWRYLFALLFICSCLINFTFQNCAPQKVNFSTDQSDKSNSSRPPTDDGGNGTGYDGKVYVDKGSCPDGSDVRSRLTVFSSLGIAIMDRENCQNLGSKRQIPLAEIQFNGPDDNQLSYQGAIYNLDVNYTQQMVYQTVGAQEFIIPQGIERIRVTVVGGGGSAGAHGMNGPDDPISPFITAGGGGGGGGAGGFAQAVLQVSPGDSFTINVGAGGAGVKFTSGLFGKNVDGKAGEESRFGDSVSAGGGASGLGGFSQNGFSGDGGLGGSGGSAVGNTIAMTGALGVSGASGKNTNGFVYHGTGGIGGSGWTLPGNTVCGGGGSGTTSNDRGFAPTAGNGCVFVEW